MDQFELVGGGFNFFAREMWEGIVLLASNQKTVSNQVKWGHQQ